MPVGASAMVAKARHANRHSTLQYLVWGLQCVGLYCFKRPTTASSANSVEISLPLLLWAVFMKTFQITQILCEYFRPEGRSLHNVDSVTRTLNIMISSGTSLLGQSLLLLNGSMLNQILLECEEEDWLSRLNRNNESASFFSIEKFMTLLFHFSLALGALVPFFLPALMGGVLRADNALLFLHCATIIIGIFLIATLFREVLIIASRKLNVDILLDQICLQDSVIGLDRLLDDLERKIRQVSKNYNNFPCVLFQLVLNPFSVCNGTKN